MGDSFLDAETSDCIIRLNSLNDGNTFDAPGHSFVVREISSVFRRMLESATSDGKGKVLEINVKGNQHVAMAFLRYLYTKQLNPLDPYSYIALAQTAHSYAMNDLISLCEEPIRETVTPYSACSVFEALKDIATKPFYDFVFELILNCAFFIFEKKLHLSLNEETMQRLLESDGLNILKEEQLLTALLSWGQAKCFFENQTSRESIMTKLIKLSPLIRWELILNEEAREQWPNRKLNSEYESGKNRDERASNNLGTLRPFWKAVNPVHGYTYSKQHMLYHKLNLISFVVKKDIILLGAALHLEYIVKLPQSHPIRDENSIAKSCTQLPFYIRVDSRSLEIVNFEDTLTGSVQKKLGFTECFRRVVRFQFKQPFLIQNSTPHCIDMYSHITNELESSDESVELETLPKHSFPPTTHITAPVFNVSNNTDPIFSVSDEVTAVWEIYYFPL